MEGENDGTKLKQQDELPEKEKKEKIMGGKRTGRDDNGEKQKGKKQASLVLRKGKSTKNKIQKLKQNNR